MAEARSRIYPIVQHQTSDRGVVPHSSPDRVWRSRIQQSSCCSHLDPCQLLPLYLPHKRREKYLILPPARRVGVYCCCACRKPGSQRRDAVNLLNFTGYDGEIGLSVLARATWMPARRLNRSTWRYIYTSIYVCRAGDAMQERALARPGSRDPCSECFILFITRTPSSIRSP